MFSPSVRARLLAILPDNYGVYAIRRDTPLPRVQGSSDIVYIGSATNQKGLKNRIGQYFSPGPTQSTNKRILALITRPQGYEIGWVVMPTITEAKAFEQELLDGYLRDHSELPPENHRR